jgi:hypothetical protein
MQIMSTDLMGTFYDVVKWFNNFDPSNWPQLEPLLHKNIKMKRIDELNTNSYLEGRDKVKDYLCVGNGRADKAVFVPDKDPDHKEIDDYGFVSGVAWFIDKTDPNPSPPRRIAYSFVYKREANNWQEIHSWGKYEGKITNKDKITKDKIKELLDYKPAHS